MAKEKKQPTVAKALAGKVKKAVKKKIKTVAKKPKLKAVKEERKDLNSEIIFDSQVGKTDALFVDAPVEIPNPQVPQEQKKTWWQKLFGI